MPTTRLAALVALLATSCAAPGVNEESVSEIGSQEEFKAVAERLADDCPVTWEAVHHFAYPGGESAEGGPQAFVSKNRCVEEERVVGESAILVLTDSELRVERVFGLSWSIRWGGDEIESMLVRGFSLMDDGSVLEEPPKDFLRRLSGRVATHGLARLAPTSIGQPGESHTDLEHTSGCGFDTCYDCLATQVTSSDVVEELSYTYSLTNPTLGDYDTAWERFVRHFGVYPTDTTRIVRLGCSTFRWDTEADADLLDAGVHTVHLATHPLASIPRQESADLLDDAAVVLAFVDGSPFRVCDSRAGAYVDNRSVGVNTVLDAFGLQALDLINLYEGESGVFEGSVVVNILQQYSTCQELCPELCTMEPCAEQDDCGAEEDTQCTLTLLADSVAADSEGDSNADLEVELSNAIALPVCCAATGGGNWDCPAVSEH